MNFINIKRIPTAATVNANPAASVTQPTDRQVCAMPYRREPTPQEIMNVGPPADAGLERQKKEKPTIKPTVEVTQPKEAEVNFIESEFEKLENFSPIIN